jgi:hypothetical protein
MTWAEYQQWEMETRAEITETAQRSRVSAGGGVSIDKGRVTVRRRDVIPETLSRNFATYSLFTWTGNNSGDLASASEYGLISFAEGFYVYTNFGGIFSGLDVRGSDGSQLKLTLQFLGHTFVGKTSRVFRYYFPVRATLVQYITDFVEGPDEDFSYTRNNPIRTVVLDLKRDPVTAQFYADPDDYRPNFVRLVSLTRI